MPEITNDFPPSVLAALDSLFLNEQVQRVILFGSRAFGDNDERSDFDLAISAPSLDRCGMIDIWEAIERSDTLYKISVSLLEVMPKNLKDRVLSTGVIIHERAQT